jgi:Forkhead domain
MVSVSKVQVMGAQLKLHANQATIRCPPARPNKTLQQNPEEKIYPKPAYSYSCLIALALKNSANGSLPVSEIYNFMW